MMEGLAMSLRMATPLILAALGGVTSERAGIINIALEGMMLSGAFAGVLLSYFTGSPWLGLTGAAGAGLGLGLLHAVLVQWGRVDAIVSGIGLNLLAVGGTTYLQRALFHQAGQSPKVAMLPAWHLPWGLGERWGLGWLEGHHPLVWTALVLVPLWQVLLWRTPFGLRLRAAGERPLALKVAGLSVRQVRTTAVLLSGLLAGLGGAALSLGQLGNFAENMSAGRGFMALAAVIFGRWTPWGAAATALLFGMGEAMQIHLQIHRVLWGWEAPVEFFLALPYLLALAALAGAGGRIRPPAALGRRIEFE